jgi:transketolase
VLFQSCVLVLIGNEAATQQRIEAGAASRQQGYVRRFAAVIRVLPDATEDLAAMRAVANLMVLSPCDGESAATLITATLEHPGPVYIRLGRGRETPVYAGGTPEGYAPGDPAVLRDGGDVLLAATGVLVQEALGAADLLGAAGISATVLDIHTLKPFPDTGIAELAARHAAVVSLEEHNVLGGLGSMVIEAIATRGVTVPAYKHGLDDEFSIIGSPTHLHEYYGLDAAGVAAVARRVLNLVTDGGFYQRDLSAPLWTAEDRRSTAEAIRARSVRATEVSATTA